MFIFYLCSFFHTALYLSLTEAFIAPFIGVSFPSHAAHFIKKVLTPLFRQSDSYAQRYCWTTAHNIQMCTSKFFTSGKYSFSTPIFTKVSQNRLKSMHVSNCRRFLASRMDHSPETKPAMGAAILSGDIYRLKKHSMNLYVLFINARNKANLILSLF